MEGAVAAVRADLITPEAKALLTQLNGEVHSDCSYPGTYR
jgi:hypothetical protein